MNTHCNFKRSDIRRILIIKWSALGDVAIATAIMEDICRAFPNAIIHLNTLPSAARFFVQDPRFDKVFTINIREKGKRLLRNWQWLQQVRAGKYDLVIDLQRTDHSRLLLACLLLSGHRIKHRLGNRGGFPYTIQPQVRDRKTHVFTSMRSLLAAAGIPAVTECPILHSPVEEVAQARQTIAAHRLVPGRFVVFLPGSQAAGWLKRWGASRYAELGKLLLARGVSQIAVIGGPDEIDECARIVDAINLDNVGTAVNLNMLPLLQIVSVCEAALYIVANDTGNAHIAAAANRPMLVICGPTDPRRVKPIGGKVRAVQAELDCINCYGKTCRIAEFPVCMEKITPGCIADILLNNGPVSSGVQIF